MTALTCYTTALHRYLAQEWDADRIVAQSIRLAVRVDLPDRTPAFSHHDPSLDRLPDGTVLRYAGAAAPAHALAGLGTELDRHGRVLVVVDMTRLDWSVRRAGPPMPHWLLVDGRRGERWHVVDGFAATLPEGEQPPYEGWLTEDRLATAMTLPPRWNPGQRLRNALAFGTAVTVPPGRSLWLRRGRAGPPPPPAGTWLVDPDDVFEFLGSRLRAPRPDLEQLHEDLWAAARHRLFAYRWRLAGPLDDRRRDDLRRAAASWESLPRATGFAVASARRGRSRTSLLAAALDAVRRAEGRLWCPA